MITDDASGEIWNVYDAAIHGAAMEIERHAMGIGCRLAKAREEGDEMRARELRAQLIAMQQVKRYVLKKSELAYRTVYGKSRKDRQMTNGKRKGKNGELEFARLCRDEGFDARRTAQYCGKTGDAADVIGLPGVHVEVKRVERLNIDDAMAQARRDSQKSGRVPIVAHRKNNCEWLITMTAADWFEMFREWRGENSEVRKNEQK